MSAPAQLRRPPTAPAGAPRRVVPDDPRWLDLLDGSQDAGPFHHPAWSAVLAGTYGFAPFVLLADDADGAAAGAPFLEARSPIGRRRWISLPFTDECAPLGRSPGAVEDFARGLAAAAPELGAPALEVRADVPQLGWERRCDAVIHELALEPDRDAVRRRFSKSQVRRNIARAERSGVTVREAVSDADHEAFLRLHLATRRRQGVPMQPRRFFSLIRRELIDGGLGSVLVARHEGRPIAAALFLHWNGTTIYKFGASDAASWDVRPNHAIFARAIDDAIDRGDRRFDFGRTDLGNDGLRAFKRSWGGVERPLTTSVLEPAHDGLAQRALGAAIRRGPAALCRGAGTVLYRYAASR